MPSPVADRLAVEIPLQRIGRGCPVRQGRRLRLAVTVDGKNSAGLTKLQRDVGRVLS